MKSIFIALIVLILIGCKSSSDENHISENSFGIDSTYLAYHKGVPVIIEGIADSHSYKIGLVLVNSLANIVTKNLDSLKTNTQSEHIQSSVVVLLKEEQGWVTKWPKKYLGKKIKLKGVLYWRTGTSHWKSEKIGKTSIAGTPNDYTILTEAELYTD